MANKSLSHTIHDEIDKRAAIRKNICRDIISTSKLARYFKKELGIKAPIDAYVSAIRRYPKERIIENIEKIKKVFYGTKMTIRTKIGLLSLMNNSDVKKELNKMDFHGYLRESFKFIMGELYITIIGDSKKIKQVLKKFDEEDIHDFKENLAEINLILSKESKKVPGVGAYVLNELALHEINLIEIITNLPESTLILAEKDAPRAYEVLHALMSK